MVKLALLAALLDVWTGRLAPVGDSVARAPRFDAWVSAVARVVALAEGDAAVARLRAEARGPLGFDPLDAAAWTSRGVRADGPMWSAHIGTRLVATVVAASAGTARRVLPDGVAVRVAGVDALRLPGLVVVEHEGHLVTATDEPALARMLGGGMTDVATPWCPPSDGALLVLLGAAPGRRVSDGVEACTVLRAAPGRVWSETHLRGTAAAGAAISLARSGVAPVLSGDGALLWLRARLAPSALALVKLHLFRQGLAGNPTVRALSDQLDGRLELALSSGGELSAVFGLRDAGATIAGELPPALFGAALPPEWRRAYPVRVSNGYAVVGAAEPAASAASAAPASAAPSLSLDLRPAALPASVVASLPALAPYAALLRHVDRLTARVTLGEVVHVALECTPAAAPGAPPAAKRRR